MKIHVDFSNVQRAAGKETTWFAGHVLVNGKEVDVDGTTDRSSWGPIILALRQVLIEAGFKFPDDMTSPHDFSDDEWNRIEDILMDNDEGECDVELEGPNDKVA